MSGYFSGFVLAFGHRQYRHLVRFAQIEGCRTDQVADVLDQQQAVVGQCEFLHRVSNHVGIEMAALAGIDLNCGHAGGAECDRRQDWSAGRPR